MAKRVKINLDGWFKASLRDYPFKKGEIIEITENQAEWDKYVGKETFIDDYGKEHYVCEWLKEKSTKKSSSGRTQDK